VQGSVVDAPEQAVALDTVEVLEVDQWLALLIIGDLDPFTPAPGSPASRHPHRKSEEPLYACNCPKETASAPDRTAAGKSDPR
jgi:hypothetical protein